MSWASAWFSGASVECQLSNEMWKPSRYGLRPAAISATNCLRRLAGLLGGDHDRRAVRVVGADEVHLVAAHALEAHPDVGLDVLHHVADVERRVGVGQRGGDEELAGHGWTGGEPAILGTLCQNAPSQRLRRGSAGSGRNRDGHEGWGAPSSPPWRSALLLLVGNFALSISNTAQLRDESARVLHSNEILLALDNVLGAGQGRRDRPARLRHHRPARVPRSPTAPRSRTIGTQLDALARLIAGDPVHGGAAGRGAATRRRQARRARADDRACASARAST